MKAVYYIHKWCVIYVKKRAYPMQQFAITPVLHVQLVLGVCVWIFFLSLHIDLVLLSSRNTLFLGHHSKVL